MDDNDYIGLFDGGETAEMLDRVNKLIWNTFDGVLPSADGMKLNRIDFCKNAELDSQNAVKAYIKLLKRGRTLKKIHFKNTIIRRQKEKRCLKADLHI